MHSSGLTEPSMMTFVPGFSCACRMICPDAGTENTSTKPKVAQSDRIALRASMYRRMGKIVCMRLLTAYRLQLTRGRPASAPADLGAPGPGGLAEWLVRPGQSEGFPVRAMRRTPVVRLPAAP